MYILFFALALFATTQQVLGATQDKVKAELQDSDENGKKLSELIDSNAKAISTIVKKAEGHDALSRELDLKSRRQLQSLLSWVEIGRVSCPTPEELKKTSESLRDIRNNIVLHKAMQARELDEFLDKMREIRETRQKQGQSQLLKTDAESELTSLIQKHMKNHGQPVNSERAKLVARELVQRFRKPQNNDDLGAVYLLSGMAGQDSLLAWGHLFLEQTTRMENGEKVFEIKPAQISGDISEIQGFLFENFGETFESAREARLANLEQIIQALKAVSLKLIDCRFDLPVVEEKLAKSNGKLPSLEEAEQMKKVYRHGSNAWDEAKEQLKKFKEEQP